MNLFWLKHGAHSRYSVLCIVKRRGSTIEALHLNLSGIIPLDHPDSSHSVQAWRLQSNILIGPKEFVGIDVVCEMLNVGIVAICDALVLGMAPSDRTDSRLRCVIHAKKSEFPRWSARCWILCDHSCHIKISNILICDVIQGGNFAVL